MRIFGIKGVLLLMCVSLFGEAVLGMNSKENKTKEQKAFRLSGNIGQLFLDGRPTKNCLEILKGYEKDLFDGKIWNYIREIGAFDEAWQILKNRGDFYMVWRKVDDKIRRKFEDVYESLVGFANVKRSLKKKKPYVDVFIKGAFYFSMGRCKPESYFSEFGSSKNFYKRFILKGKSLLESVYLWAFGHVDKKFYTSSLRNKLFGRWERDFSELVFDSNYVYIIFSCGVEEINGEIKHLESIIKDRRIRFGENSDGHKSAILINEKLKKYLKIEKVVDEQIKEQKRKKLTFDKRAEFLFSQPEDKFKDHKVYFMGH